MESIEVNDLLHAFIRSWEGKKPSKELPLAYMSLAINMLFGDEELVRRVIQILIRNITAWADKYSPVYKQHIGITDRSYLLDKALWYVNSMDSESMSMDTSGTTTGKSFAYRRWETTLRPIEVTNHYKMVLQEFGLEKHPKVMYMLGNIWKIGKVVTILTVSENFSECHGADEAEIHFVENTPLYYENQDEFFNIVLDHLCKHPVDVILTNGVHINSFVYHIKRLGIKQRLAKLLSNTSVMLILDDADWLQDNGIVQDVCDHMRCWDGGASFFTCKFGRYHLMDNLAYCYADDRRLISTDYFSLPAPFINYWNGDYCYIENDYKRCECGRLYRPFQLLQSRPFSLKGKSIAEWQTQIEAAEITGIKQVKCAIDNVEIMTTKELTIWEQEKLKDIMKGFPITFKQEL